MIVISYYIVQLDKLKNNFLFRHTVPNYLELVPLYLHKFNRQKIRVMFCIIAIEIPYVIANIPIPMK